ncbi:hypothetical protein J4573_07790 [Actinomadura barringtoniae]|uniref:Polysaccharide chain length determinant N-terminal domain-containing protein n=1 Tax=Actinomadura barringtoniae TaxID=1427535 RepID=A0A939P825_9ACTN|nr:hypothetical protein [Actinomadura barringtoniae]MBO2446987.1 hypothetical protein [Actinomadura barringtoniae]
MTAQNPVPATPEISLIEAVWRYRLMSFIIVLASVLASVAATQILFSSVNATARFAVTDPTNNNNVLRMGVVSGQGYATYTAQRAAFAGSAPVLARAAEIVKSKHGPSLTAAQLRARVQTSSKPDGGVVIVTASAGSMGEAAGIANAVVQAYQDVTVSTAVDKLDKQLKSLQDAQKKITDDLEVTTRGTSSYRLMSSNLAKLQSQESGVLSAKANANDGVQFVDTADAASSAGSKLPQNAVIGLALGVIIACIVSFLRASGRNRPRPVVAVPEIPAGPPPGPGPDPAAGTPAIAGPSAERAAPVSEPVADWVADRAADWAAERSHRTGRRGRDGASAVDPAVERAVERAGRVWTPEEVHGPLASPALEKESGRDSGRGKRSGNKNNGKSNGTSSLLNVDGQDDPTRPTEIPVELWAPEKGGGDPTSTQEDRSSRRNGTGGATSTGNGSGGSGSGGSGGAGGSGSSSKAKDVDRKDEGGDEGKGDSSLMHYDLDR